MIGKLRFPVPPAFKCIALTLPLVLLAVASAGSHAAGENLNVSLRGTPLRTAAVNESGKSYEKRDIKCIDAPRGRHFEQASFKARAVSHHDAAKKSCTLSFESYSDFFPGIVEPNRACLHSYVKSVGGVNNFGSRGHLTCEMTGRVRAAAEYELETIEPIEIGATDATVTLPNIPASISIEVENRSLISASVPLSLLQFQINKALRDSPPKLPAGLKMSVSDGKFIEYRPGRPAIAYSLKVRVHEVADCRLTLRFSLPAAKLVKLQLQDVGTSASCSTGGFIGKIADLPNKLSTAIISGVSEVFRKRLFHNNESYQQWAKQDPRLAVLLDAALSQAAYCNYKGEPGLCLLLGWRDRNAIAKRESDLLGESPLPTTLPDQAIIARDLREHLGFASEKLQAALPDGTKFPAGFDAKGKPHDSDMALFGGLLCLSGMELGCDLVSNSQSSDGRFWRSPRRIGEADTPDHATFSGDQMKGVLAYVIRHDDKDALSDLLTYLRSKPTSVPDAKFKLEHGYSSCPNFAPEFTCLLSGFDWHVLKILAERYNLKDLLPDDINEAESKYGFSYDGILLESLMINNGYRLHLVGVQIWLLQALQIEDPRLQKAARILAGREPYNAFFVYLALGRDERVRQIAERKCPSPASREDFRDWQWQRAEADEAWKVAMVWDCAFVYSLLKLP